MWWPSPPQFLYLLKMVKETTTSKKSFLEILNSHKKQSIQNNEYSKNSKPLSSERGFLSRKEYMKEYMKRKRSKINSSNTSSQKTYISRREYMKEYMKRKRARKKNG